MRKLFLLLSAMGLLIGLSQCTKPEVQEIAGGQTITQEVTVTADFGDGSKVSFTEPDPATGQLDLAWEQGDRIKVYEGSSTNPVGDLARVSGNTFTGDITATVGSTLTFRYGSTDALAALNAIPTYTSQTGALDWLKDNCCLQGTATCVASGSYNVTMGLTYAILKLDLSALGGDEDVTISDGSVTVTLTGVTTTPHDYYIAMPVYDASRTYTFNGNGKSFYRTWKIMANSFYTADNGSGFGTGSAIVIEPGAFTVSDPDGTPGSGDEVKVEFSPGNLQFHTTEKTWRFAEHQWDMCDENTEDHPTTDYAEYTNKWIDLFGWGTSGWDNGNHLYRPYDTDNSTYDYSVGYGYGPTDGSSYEFDLTGDYANSDWGVNNTIYSGGTPTTGWRTLTNAEWGYLLNDRKVTVGGVQKASYGHGTVNGVKGLIILPDNWDSSVCSGFTYGYSEWSNTFSEWTSPKWSEMEAVGAVFLPAAGCRNGTSVFLVGSYGRYWSSSCNHSHDAFNLQFYSSDVYKGALNRYFGLSVRLVR